MARLLNVDPRLRRICLLDEKERGYPRSVLSRFARRVGAENLEAVITEKVLSLLKRNRVEQVDAVLDASFIKASATQWTTEKDYLTRKRESEEQAEHMV
jgi:hypothetical protein